MAVAVVKFKNGKKGMGTPHFDYIMRQGKYEPKKDDLERLVTTGSGNMPSWATDDPKFFWNMADELERENGRIYKEHIIALPRELNDTQLTDLARALIKEHIGDKHPYSFAIHAPLATDGKEQPHLHFMYSERTLDGIERGSDTFFKRYNSKHPERGGCKKANLAMKKGEARQQAKELRYRIGDTINKHLELANRPERVDMRSKRDIERLELEQAQAELSQELLELEQLDQATDFTPSDLTDVLARLQLEQAEIVVKPQPRPEPQPRTADDYLASLKAQIKDSPEQPTAIVDEYEQRRQQVAQGFFNRALKALSDKYNKIVAQVKEIEANKPKIWQLWESKDIWQSKIDTATAERGDTKRAYHTLKQQGVSRVHFEQAERYIKEREPDLYNRYLSATEPEQEPERFNGSDKGIGTPPPTVQQRELSDKAKIGLQTIKNVIDAMPSGEKKDKAMAEFEHTQATATTAQLEALAQLDVKVNKQPDIVIQAPSQSQDQSAQR